MCPCHCFCKRVSVLLLVLLTACGGGGGGGEEEAEVEPPVPLTHPLYGVSVDDLTELDAIVASLKALPRRPMVRVTLDPDTPLSDYQEALPRLHGVAFIMGEILDSSYFPDACGEPVCDAAQYRERTRRLVAALGPHVDIWEIANEINGEWLRPHPEGSDEEIAAESQAIAERVMAADEVVHAAGGKTAVTLWYNDDGVQHCWLKAQDNWASWVGQYFSQPLRERVDYAFFSYYPLDGCPGLSPDWEQDFARLGELFPRAYLGFGELGAEDIATAPEAQLQLIRDYYPLVQRISHPRYVEGVFWWNYVEEMLPWPQSLFWQELNTIWTLLPTAVVLPAYTE